MENQQQPSEVKKVIWAAVKETARNHIGQPPATKVRGNRKGGRRSDGRHRAGVSGALDIYDHTQEELDYIPNAPRLATNPALHGARVTGIPSRYLHDVRQRKHEKETLFHFSPEAITQANYLRATQGDGAVNEYLKKIKESSVDHLEMAKVQATADEKRHQNVAGDVEQQVSQAEAKAKHFREEAERFEKLADEQDRVASKFREILDILGGDGPGKQGSRKMLARGEWDRRWRECANVPISLRDLREKIIARYQCLRGAAYAAVAKARGAGKLKDVGDGLLQYVPKAESDEE